MKQIKFRIFNNYLDSKADCWEKIGSKLSFFAQKGHGQTISNTSIKTAPIALRIFSGIAAILLLPITLIGLTFIQISGSHQNAHLAAIKTNSVGQKCLNSMSNKIENAPLLNPKESSPIPPVKKNSVKSQIEPQLGTCPTTALEEQNLPEDKENNPNTGNKDDALDHLKDLEEDSSVIKSSIQSTPLKSPEEQQAERNEQFFSAVLEGDIEKLEELKKAGIDVNQTDKDDRSALHYAVEKQSLQVIEWLINNGADPLLQDPLLTKKNSDYILGSNNFAYLSKTVCTTPLFRIIEEGHLDLVQLLIKHSKQKILNAFKIDQYSTVLSPLAYAAYKGKFEIATLLLTEGFDINQRIRDEYKAFSPMFLAIISYQFSKEKSLSEQNVFIEFVCLALNRGYRAKFFDHNLRPFINAFEKTSIKEEKVALLNEYYDDLKCMYEENSLQTFSYLPMADEQKKQVLKLWLKKNEETNNRYRTYVEHDLKISTSISHTAFLYLNEKTLYQMFDTESNFFMLFMYLEEKTTKEDSEFLLKKLMTHQNSDERIIEWIKSQIVPSMDNNVLYEYLLKAIANDIEGIPLVKHIYAILTSKKGLRDDQLVKARDRTKYRDPDIQEEIENLIGIYEPHVDIAL